MHKHNITPLFTAEQIKARIDVLAKDIAAVMPPDVLVVALLRGSFVFAADLVRALHAHGCHPQIDFMTMGSYGAEQKSSGTVTLHRDMETDVQGRTILLVDDILESARTLHFARELLLSRGAGKIHIAVLLEKPGYRLRDILADYVGFTVPDKFVVGYGLDSDNYHRELPFIGVVEE